MLLQIIKAEFLQDGTQVGELTTTLLEGVTRVAAQDKNTVFIRLGSEIYFKLERLKKDPTETPHEALLNRSIVSVYLISAQGETMDKLI